MDQQAQPVVNPNFPQYVMMPVRTRNGLGAAGFFIALIGLVIPTGVIALLGLLVSLVALGKSPRGFAGMGVLVGLLGTVAWIAIMVFAVVSALVVGGSVAGMFVLLTQAERVEVTSDMLNVAIAAKTYDEEHDAMPESINDLGLDYPALHDPWGTPYRLVLIDDEPGFDILCAGEDGEFDSDDDAAFTSLDRMWDKAFDNFPEKMEAFAHKMERLDGNQHGNLLAQWESECRKDRDHGYGYEQIARAEAEALAAAESVEAAHQAPSHDGQH